MTNPLPQPKPRRTRQSLGQARADLARAQAEEWATRAVYQMLRRVIEAVIRGERL